MVFVTRQAKVDFWSEILKMAAMSLSREKNPHQTQPLRRQQKKIAQNREFGLHFVPAWLGWSVLLIVILVFSRLLPHIPNVTATAAVGLFSIRIFKQRILRYFIPLLGMVLSDILISGAPLGLHSTSVFVYAALALIIFVNEKNLQNWDRSAETKNKLGKFSSLIVPWLSSSLIFFVVSNFAVWSVDQMYPKTVAGLFQCFAMAIPFYWTQLGGDFLYIFSLFGLFEFIRALNHSRSAAAPQE